MSTKDLEHIFRADGFSVVCMPGEAKPSLVLSSKAVADLLVVWRAASMRAKSLHPDALADAVGELCNSLESALKTYEKQSIEWWAKQPLPPEYQQAMNEIAAARKLMEGFDFDPEDGPRRA